MKPFFFAVHYWELHWMFPIIKKTGWPVLAESDVCKEFCNKHKIKMITAEEAKDYDKLIICLMHFGQHREMINQWWKDNKPIYVIQRAFDAALNIYDTFWSVDMHRFTKYFISNQFDYDLLKPKYGDKLVFTGSPRLWMASQAGKRNLDDIYKKVGTKDFYIATVIGGAPIHDDNLPNYYFRDLPQKSPYKIVYKLHPDGNYRYHKDTYPDAFLWDDARLDPWETYKLIAASRGVITPSSFLAIEATIMGKPVILEGDVSNDEYNRQAEQRQRERLPRSLSSDISNPVFNDAQEQLRKTYIYDKESISRIIHEIVV